MVTQELPLNASNLTVVVGTTSDCNMSCKYCYRLKRQTEYMSDSTLENAVRTVLSDRRKSKICFLWHGGEPLLVGKDFYRKAMARISNNTEKYKELMKIGIDAELNNTNNSDRALEAKYGNRKRFPGSSS